MLRAVLAVAALNAAGILVVGGTGTGPAAGQQKIPAPIPDGPVDPKMPFFLVCAKACDDCGRMCETCSAHCAKLVLAGNKEHHDTLKLCQDCAAICTACGRVTAKDGPLADLIAAACADACKRCGDACEKHAHDPIMKQCAEECRRCEKACREMAKIKAAAKPAKEEKDPATR